MMGQEINTGFPAHALELLAVECGQLVKAAPGEHVVNVGRIHGGMGILGQLLGGARDTPRRLLQPEQHDRAEKPHRAGQRLGDGAPGVPERALEIAIDLEEDHSKSEAEAYQIRRFFVPPTDASNYQIFSSPNQPSDVSAPWVTSFITATSPALTTPVAGGILAFWVRCFDSNGDLIPWLSSNTTGVGPLKFNSAAHFQVATPGQPASFKYTNASTTAPANLLPATVELTIVTLDPQTFRRNPFIPAQNAQTAPDDLPNVRDAFSQSLISNNIKNAHTFSTRVNLVNSGQR